jgi:molybdate transport system substrate-binding protein
MFKKRQLLTSIAGFIVTCAFTFLLSIGFPLIGVAQQPATLTVSSGAGLRDVMQTVKQAYEQQAPNVDITYNFAASGVLRRQIEQGAPVDIVLLALEIF